MQELKLKVKGLYTHPSDLGSAPDGALSVADDIVIDREETAEPRRGFNRSNAALSASANSMFFYQGYILTLFSSNTLAYYTNTTTGTFGTSGAWTSLAGTIAPISGYKMRSAESNQNLYLTTSLGLYKTTGPTVAPVLAGAYKALDLQGSTSASTGVWLADKSRVAYRLVWGYKDSNKNLILGAPSQRESFKNSAGATKAVDLTFTVPVGVNENWFYQLYRSTAVDNTSADTEPSDELGLVFEGNPTVGSFSTYSKTFATTDVNTATEVITVTAHGFVAGDAVVFSSTTTVPAGLTAGTTYYVISPTTNTLQVSATYGGSAVNITSTGTGTHTIKGAQRITVTDVTPDVLRGATIYTAATQEGLVAGNEQPPLCRDIAVYKNVLFYANTTSKHRLYETLLAVGGTSGIVVDDTFTVGGVTYTGKAVEAVTSAQFAVVTSGSASQNIRDTALSLTRTINQYSSSTVYAYYVSGADDLPGKILFEERSLGGAAFTASASRTTCWTPNPTTNGTSTNDRFKNGLYFSKASQPEAAPLSRFFFCGSAQKEILRIVALRDSLFILKEDGIYRLIGDDVSNFRVELFDNTTKLLASNSVAVLNNQIYALTDQGVVAISESGVAVRSRPIEYTLLSLQGANSSVLQSESFGISYETERKYILFVPKIAGDTGPTQAFVYNVFTNSWTRWVLAKACGGVNPADNKLYLGDSATAYVNQERKSYSYQDYVDYGSSATISAVNGLVLTMTGTDGVSPGDVIYQSASVYSIVDSVNTIAGTVTTQFLASFSVAAVDIYKAISSKIAWVPVTFGNAGILKQVREATLLFKQDYTGTGTLLFTSDVSPSQESETITGTAIGLWGLFGWGNVGWGGTNTRRPIRIYVPRNKQRCSQLTVEFRHSTGYAAYQLNGLSLIANQGSERVAV